MLIAYLQESKIINRRNGCIVEVTLFNSFKLLNDQVYLLLYNNQINARALIGQSAMVYCAGKPMEKSRVLRIIT